MLKKINGHEIKPGASLYGVDFSGKDLSGLDLSGADLRNSNLSACDLRNSNLTGADLFGANLSFADISGANLTGVMLWGVNLRGVIADNVYIEPPAPFRDFSVESDEDIKKIGDSISFVVPPRKYNVKDKENG